MIDLFNDLFGQYTPIQNIASTISDGVNTTTTYQYNIDFGIICHYALIVILFFTVCKVIGSIITNLTRSVSIR